MGVKEQIIFPEIEYDKIDSIKGMNISIVTTAKTDAEGRALLGHLGMPFRRSQRYRWPDRVRKDRKLAKFMKPKKRQVQGPHQEPLQALRPLARVHPQVRDVPPAASASWRSAVTSPASSSRAGKEKHVDDRSDR